MKIKKYVETNLVSTSGYGCRDQLHRWVVHVVVREGLRVFFSRRQICFDVKRRDQNQSSVKKKNFFFLLHIFNVLILFFRSHSFFLHHIHNTTTTMSKVKDSGDALEDDFQASDTEYLSDGQDGGEQFDNSDDETSTAAAA